MNWRPGPGRWSVAQCLDHLITTHSLYFPLLERLAEGAGDMTWWERWSPFSGLLGRLLIQAVDPDNAKKVKAPAMAQPSASRIESDIVDRFQDHQDSLIGHLKALPPDIDRQRIVTSPMHWLITYSLDDTLDIFVKHTRRHLEQAIQVMEDDRFPRP